MKKWIIWFIVLAVIGYIAWWLWADATRPLPGEQLEDIGQGHVTDISNITYNSHPPTSGTHFPIWAKQGVYDRVISDGYLIHSLEHGYIVISYDCSVKTSNGFSIIKKAFAHGEEEVVASPSAEATQSAKPLMMMRAQVGQGTSWVTPEAPPEKEVELPESFATDECKNLVEKLRPYTKDFQRVIVVPHPGLETQITLTAWTRLLKLNQIEDQKIRDFIEVYHNRGPEKTVE